MINILYEWCLPKIILLFLAVPATLTPTQVLERQGPSVHHLSTDFIKNTLEAVSDQMATMEGISDSAEAKIYHMVQAYGRPAGLIVTCPRDGKSGAAYVDTLTGAENVGIANALLSYSWGYKVRVGSWMYKGVCLYMQCRGCHTD